MKTILNPILPGFNPDPSICRRGDDYYIATSTFEWFPGVQIHHSRDLVHWRLLTRPLDRLTQLDLRGVPDSGRVWAPALSWAHDRFWLIYTDVKNMGTFKDTHNYLVTAPDITGPWSDPVYLNSSGFDPSLFHDADGRQWLVNMRWDHRQGRNRFNGIVLQEYDHNAGRLVGPISHIFAGSGLGCTEGPHLFRRDGWVYLMTAEGGTGHNHAVTMARSRELTGPYEVDPAGPVVTSRDRDHLPLQKAGHASLVEAGDGTWWMPHLCGRPVNRADARRCILGRETALQQVEWTPDGWLRLVGGGNAPRLQWPGPDLPAAPWPEVPERVEFEPPALPLDFQTLRIPADPSWVNLEERPGWLRLRGQESLKSHHRQSLVGRRIQHLHLSVETRLDFEPESFQQAAGLLAHYDTRNGYYLNVTADDEGRRILGLALHDHAAYHEIHEDQAHLEPGPIDLGFDLAGNQIQFRWRQGQVPWQNLGPALDATKLSDEYGGGLRFTGAFVSLACQDLSGRRQPADFSGFTYRVNHSQDR
ncbi:MAG: glycoside hydrolase family 43 protein [Verrucomicrobia bacterium]|nr:glycoside hydrolase family 43 protein [Verrucomicrobiota bacterium]MCH8512944.1 glycoside hydrolase family 43 protein [Kiritimatiellia bacterium]